MKKIILILIVLTAILEGCKKYEEGPWISFRSPLNRIYGYYTLTLYSVDGVDSLNEYNDSLGLNFHFLYDDINGIHACEISGLRKNGTSSLPVGWRWKLSNNKKILNVYMSLSLTEGIGPFGNNKIMDWEILRLKNMDIKMKTNYGGKEYKIELKGI